MKILFRCLGLLAAGVLVGCHSVGEPSSSFTVTDSAGVEIVHSHRPAWDDESAWRVSADPLIQIGRIEGEEPYLLDRVMDVARLEDGRIVVAMMGDNTIRFYDPQGDYLNRIGGSGEGPSEFAQLFGLFRQPGRLIGWEISPRLNVFDEATGEFMREVVLPAPARFRVPRGLFRDGSALFHDTPQGWPVRDGTYTMNSTVVRAFPGGRVDTLGVYPSLTFVAVQNRFPAHQEYGPSLVLLADGDRFYQAYTASFEIREHTPDGRLVRKIRRTWEPIPVTEEDRERHREGLLGLGTEGGGEVPPDLLQQRQDMIDAMIYPQYHPAHGRMYRDRVGNLWVARAKPNRMRRGGGFVPVDETPRPWDVFDRRGAWLGSVELPARFRMREIGYDYVAGVWKNAFDVEFVRIYELVKPAG